MAKFVQRGRDVHYMIMQEGEAGLRKAVIKLAEDNEMMRQELADLVKVTGGIISSLRTQLQLSASHAKAMDAIQKKFHPNNEANPDQKWSDK